MSTRQVSTVATDAWTIVMGWNSAPLGIRITLTIELSTMTVIRKNGRVAQAASGITAHSRYHGCTTGNSSTSAPSATPSAPTGCSRPVSAATSMRTTTNAATSAAIGRVRLSTAVVWSPRPSSTPPNPVITPSEVGSDIQLRTAFAVPSVWIHPKPSPLAPLTNSVTASATASEQRAAANTARQPPPQRRASAIPTKPNAIRDGILIVDDSAITPQPPSSSVRLRPRIGSLDSIAASATSMPASMSPSIRASLCTPATRCSSTRGFAAPSHSALTGATPQRRASRGSAHTMSATPQSANSRCRKMPATMLSPVTEEMPRPIHRNSGPYGAGVSRQIVGTVRVSTSSTPSACAGPIAYGSIPRAVISLCAR